MYDGERVGPVIAVVKEMLHHVLPVAHCAPGVAAACAARGAASSASAASSSAAAASGRACRGRARQTAAPNRSAAGQHPCGRSGARTCCDRGAAARSWRAMLGGAHAGRERTRWGWYPGEARWAANRKRCKGVRGRRRSTAQLPRAPRAASAARQRAASGRRRVAGPSRSARVVRPAWRAHRDKGFRGRGSESDEYNRAGPLWALQLRRPRGAAKRAGAAAGRRDAAPSRERSQARLRAPKARQLWRDDRAA